jgi:hypothetical protein
MTDQGYRAETSLSEKEEVLASRARLRHMRFI